MTVPCPRHTLLAATLAVATALAGSTVHAAVVTRSLNASLTTATSTTVAASKTTTIDVNGDGANDFSFTHSTNPVGSIGPGGDKTDYNGKLTLDAATASQFLSIVKDSDALAGEQANYAEALAAGATVGAQNTFISLTASTYDDRLLDSSDNGDAGAFSVQSGERVGGFLTTPTDAYVGFAFGNATTPNYGYLQFTAIDDDSANNSFLVGGDLNGATLVGYAYETTPGVAITIAVPEPAAFAAIGIAGLALVKRRRA